MSSSPAATTVSSSPPQVNRSATATGGPSPTSLDDGALVVSHVGGHGTVTLPAEYVREHVRLGYAATEHGHQGDTVDVAYELVTRATTHRGLYVGATRGRDANHLFVVTDTGDPTEARDVLEHVLANDRVDIPAVAQRRHLADQTPHPTRPARAEIPDWFDPVRRRLVERRDDAGRPARPGRRRAVTEPASTWPPSNPTSTPPRPRGRPTPPRSPSSANSIDQTLKPAQWAAAADARTRRHRPTTRSPSATSTRPDRRHRRRRRRHRADRGRQPSR